MQIGSAYKWCKVINLSDKSKYFISFLVTKVHGFGECQEKHVTQTISQIFSICYGWGGGGCNCFLNATGKSAVCHDSCSRRTVWKSMFLVSAKPGILAQQNPPKNGSSKVLMCSTDLLTV